MEKIYHEHDIHTSFIKACPMSVLVCQWNHHLLLEHTHFISFSNLSRDTHQCIYELNLFKNGLGCITKLNGYWRTQWVYLTKLQHSCKSITKPINMYTKYMLILNCLLFPIWMLLSVTYVCPLHGTHDTGHSHKNLTINCVYLLS